MVGERLIVISTGGKDWSSPTTAATPVEGGWRVNGRKTFASMSPMGDVAVTFAVVGAAEVRLRGCSSRRPSGPSSLVPAKSPPRASRKTVALELVP